jgi:hypothetical protein
MLFTLPPIVQCVIMHSAIACVDHVAHVAQACAEARGGKPTKGRDEGDREPKRADSKSQDAKGKGAEPSAGRRRTEPSIGPSSLDMFSHLPPFRERNMHDALATRQVCDGFLSTSYTLPNGLIRVTR